MNDQTMAIPTRMKKNVESFVSRSCAVMDSDSSSSCSMDTCQDSRAAGFDSILSKVSLQNNSLLKSNKKLIIDKKSISNKKLMSDKKLLYSEELHSSRITDSINRPSIKRNPTTWVDIDQQYSAKSGNGVKKQEFSFIGAHPTKEQKAKQIIDVYVQKSKRPAPVSPRQKTSSYINRLAKEKEIARINNIIVKKLLNVKSSVLSFR